MAKKNSENQIPSISNIEEAWKQSFESELNSTGLSEEAINLIKTEFPNIEDAFKKGDDFEKRKRLFPHEVKFYLEKLFASYEENKNFDYKDAKAIKLAEECQEIFKFLNERERFFDPKKLNLDGFKRVLIARNEENFVFGFVFPGNITQEPPITGKKEFTFIKPEDLEKEGSRFNAVKLKFMAVNFEGYIVWTGEMDILFANIISLKDKSTGERMDTSISIYDAISDLEKRKNEETSILKFEIAHENKGISSFFSFGVKFPKNQEEDDIPPYCKSKVTTFINTG